MHLLIIIILQRKESQSRTPRTNSTNAQLQETKHEETPDPTREPKAGSRKRPKKMQLMRQELTVCAQGDRGSSSSNKQDERKSLRPGGEVGENTGEEGVVGVVFWTKGRFFWPTAYV